MYRHQKKLLEIERIRTSIATDLHGDIGSTLTRSSYSDVGLREPAAATTLLLTGEEQAKASALFRNRHHLPYDRCHE
jgi:hypothetical protein